MSKQIAFVLTGLTLALSSVGCCCLGGGYGMNRCAPCGGGCPTNGGGYYAPQGASYQSFDASQTAYLSSTTQTATIPNSAIMGAPIMASPGGYTTTALVPANSLPTY